MEFVAFTGGELEGFDEGDGDGWEQNGSEKEDEANSIGGAGDFATCHHFVDEVAEPSDVASLTDSAVEISVMADGVATPKHHDSDIEQ